MVSNGNIFETSWYMRGFEQMLMDVMTDEELVHAIMGRVTDFYVAFFSRILEAARGRDRPRVHRGRHRGPARAAHAALRLGAPLEAVPPPPERTPSTVTGQR